ncbi:hypothetical protein KM043_004459 [Ampulex compressa]|nr:hypothetical protein KM043_004459 [Ampulex compressa]
MITPILQPCLKKDAPIEDTREKGDEKKSNKRKAGLAMDSIEKSAFAVDDRVDRGHQHPGRYPLLIDRYVGRWVAGQLVDGRNVIICGAGMDASFHPLDSPAGPRASRWLAMPNPPSGC